MSDLQIGDRVYHRKYGCGVVEADLRPNGVGRPWERYVRFEGVRRSCRDSRLTWEGAPPPRVLVIDIETMPHKVYAWDLWKQDIAPSQVIEPKRTASFAAKWTDEPEVIFRSEFHDGREAMIRDAWNLMDEADAIVGYNSKRFDVKHLNTEFVLAGLGPPSGAQQVDLYPIVRREFAFGSNKLGSIADRLGLDGKHAHEGMGLWAKCDAGDEDAWERMRAYNCQDVRVTEQLLDVIWDWVPLRGVQSQKRLREVMGT